MAAILARHINPPFALSRSSAVNELEPPLPVSAEFDLCSPFPFFLSALKKHFLKIFLQIL